MIYTLLQYQTVERDCPVDLWLDELHDVQTTARILARLNRLIGGNFGDCKPLGKALYELRLDFGPGYRVYYAKVGPAVILLLCGGDKRTQSADISSARQYLADYLRRSKQ